MAIFKGTGVAIVTPMHEDGKVNFEKLEEILEDQIANSTDAIVICGTTGESSTLTHGEHLQTIKFTIDKVNKRVPVIAGTGSNCTETAIMMSKEAASYGADALLIVTPYYNKATQKVLSLITQQLPMQFRKLRSSCTTYRPYRLQHPAGYSSLPCKECKEHCRNQGSNRRSFPDRQDDVSGRRTA